MKIKKEFDIKKLFRISVKPVGIKKKTKKRIKQIPPKLDKNHPKIKEISFEMIKFKQSKGKKKKITRKNRRHSGYNNNEGNDNELKSVLNCLETEKSVSKKIELITSKDDLYLLQKAIMNRAYELLKTQSKTEIEKQLHEIFGFKKETIRRVSLLL